MSCVNVSQMLLYSGFSVHVRFCPIKPRLGLGTMRRYGCNIIGAALLLTLGGCTSFLQTSLPLAFDSEAPVHKGNDKAFMGHRVHVVEIINKEAGTDFEEKEFDKALASVSVLSNNFQIRNDIISDIMYSSDTNCGAYLKKLRSYQVTSRLLSDFFAGGLATASSLVPAFEASKALAGASAFSVAEGSSVDRNVFAQQAAETIADAILKDRDEIRAGIRQNMGLTYSAWPLADAMSDAIRYHDECSVLRGLAHISGALQQRELSIQAVRAAAATAETDSQSAAAMLTVIAAIQNPPAPPTIPSTDTTTWNSDLQTTSKQVGDCLTKMQSAAEALAAGAAGVEASVEAACPASKDWSGFRDAAFQSIDYTVLGGELGDKTNVDKYFASVISIYQTKSSKILNDLTAARSVMVAGLKAWTGPVNNLPAFLRTVGGNTAAPMPTAADPLSVFTPALTKSESTSFDPIFVQAIATAQLGSQAAAPLNTPQFVAQEVLTAATNAYKAIAPTTT